MKINYIVSVKLCVEGVKPEELARITDVVSEVYYNGSGPTISSIQPEYVYDYCGRNEDLKGTYKIIFENGLGEKCSSDFPKAWLRRHDNGYSDDLKELVSKLREL